MIQIPGTSNLAVDRRLICAPSERLEPHIPERDSLRHLDKPRLLVNRMLGNTSPASRKDKLSG